MRRLAIALAGVAVLIAAVLLALRGSDAPAVAPTVSAPAPRHERVEPSLAGSAKPKRSRLAWLERVYKFPDDLEQPLDSEDPDDQMEARRRRYIKRCWIQLGRSWCTPFGERFGRCAHKDGHACLELATAMRAAGELDAAQDFAQEACWAGTAEGCAAYKRGHGWWLHAHHDRAASDITAACDGGDQEACVHLGVATLDRAPLETACNAGSLDGCIARANLAATADERVQWLRRACEDLARPGACDQLADILDECGGACGELGDFIAYGTFTGDYCAAPCPNRDPALAEQYRKRRCALCSCCAAGE